MTFETGMIIILIIGFFMCFKNIIYGEALMAIYLLATDLSEKTKLHEVYCLMIAAIVAIIFCVIMYKIKVLRYVLSLGISIAFARMIWTDAHARMDNTWSIFWTILSFVIMIGLHVMGYERMKEDIADEGNQK